MMLKLYFRNTQFNARQKLNYRMTRNSNEGMILIKMTNHLHMDTLIVKQIQMDILKVIRNINYVNK